MKRIFVLFLALLLLSGCSAQPAETETTVPPTVQIVTEPKHIVPETTETIPEETEPPVIYADQLANGSYEINVDSNASMFRVVKCMLTVENGNMTAAMTMSGQGYGMVYMGTGKEALADSEEAYIPFTEDENGAKVFTVPVEALNLEHDCAAWSIRKEKWYDRVLIFESETLPPEAFHKEIADGNYTVGVTLSGGSGRASIASPASVTIRDGEAIATIRWSSPFYEYVLIGETRFEPVQTEGNATFEIPVSFDEDMKISASTVAMSQPYLVDYTLHFDSATLQGE